MIIIFRRKRTTACNSWGPTTAVHLCAEVRALVFSAVSDLKGLNDKNEGGKMSRCTGGSIEMAWLFSSGFAAAFMIHPSCMPWLCVLVDRALTADRDTSGMTGTDVFCAAKSRI